MGRPEAPGCFCTVNDLLKYGIETLSQDYGITIIDREAGPEQVNRRVIQSIDTLLIVTDTSNRSLKTASDIMKTFA
jgi:CO dehydrogenase maturation factor